MSATIKNPNTVIFHTTNYGWNYYYLAENGKTKIGRYHTNGHQNTNYEEKVLPYEVHPKSRDGVEDLLGNYDYYKNNAPV